MADDLDHLARILRDARRARRWSQQNLADAAGVSVSTVKNLEGGRSFKTSPSRETREGIEHAFDDWAQGSFDSVLAGGDPILLSAGPSDERPERLPTEVPSDGWVDLDDGEVMIRIMDGVTELTPDQRRVVLRLLDTIRQGNQGTDEEDPAQG